VKLVHDLLLDGFQGTQMKSPLVKEEAILQLALCWVLVFVLAAFCWTKSFMCNVAASSRVYSSAMFFEKILWSFQGFISVPCQPFGRRGISSGRSSVSNIHPVAHQCLEASKCARFHPSGRNGKSSERSSEFEKTPVFQRIRPDDVAIPSGRHSVFDKH
jgi:hypothetical protein